MGHKNLCIYGRSPNQFFRGRPAAVIREARQTYQRNSRIADFDTIVSLVVNPRGEEAASQAWVQVQHLPNLSGSLVDCAHLYAEGLLKLIVQDARNTHADAAGGIYDASRPMVVDSRAWPDGQRQRVKL